MAASANTAALAQPPDPHQDQATDAPARATRLRRVLRKLIRHGTLLAQDLTRRPSGMTVFWIAVRFGTKDVAQILARITRGLRMAAALQATLPKPQREHPARPAPAARKPRTRPTPPPRNDVNAVLATLPTSKEIADQLRDRPIGEILTEICTALGILTADQIWQELESVLLENGADPATVVEDSENRIANSEGFFPPGIWQSPLAPQQPTPPQPAPHRAATAPSTGPP